MAENHIPNHKYYQTSKWYINPSTQMVEELYLNPDAYNGDQWVKNEYSFEELADLARKSGANLLDKTIDVEAFKTAFEQREANCKQTLFDRVEDLEVFEWQKGRYESANGYRFDLSTQEPHLCFLQLAELIETYRLGVESLRESETKLSNLEKYLQDNPEVRDVYMRVKASHPIFPGHLIMMIESEQYPDAWYVDYCDEVGNEVDGAMWHDPEGEEPVTFSDALDETLSNYGCDYDDVEVISEKEYNDIIKRAFALQEQEVESPHKAPRLGDTQRQSTDASRELNSGRSTPSLEQEK